LDPLLKTKRLRTAAAAVVLLLTISYALLMLSACCLVVFGDQAHIDDYHFGSESMIAHGGWRYASAGLYAWTAFTEGTLALAVGVAFSISLYRRSRVALVCGCLVVAGWLIASILAERALG
jgi:hypothetical protein